MADSYTTAFPYIDFTTASMIHMFLNQQRRFVLKIIIAFIFAVISFKTVDAQDRFLKSNVTFYTSNTALQTLYNKAEEKARWNLQTFGPYKVLVEGAGYQNVWLETQPMGGAMYAKRNVEVARNNQAIFMDLQRADGRLPGMVSFENGKLVPHYGWFQGFCFPQPAFDMWYWLQKDTAYLQRLYEVLKKWDAYLWRTRDSDGDGCLETWCVWDTGEDNCVRLAGAPDYWPYDEAPSREKLDRLPAAERQKMHQQASTLR